jgi:pyrroloquinoline quinone biosynthesis protein B
MLRIVVLGAAAGGGVPQWNCGCVVCTAARAEHPELRSTQTSIAISADGENWFLINASPDLRQQLTQTPQLHPGTGKLRHSPIAGVILTNGEVDAIAGLLSLREGWPFTIYAHRRVIDTVNTNSIFNVLAPGVVGRQAIDLDEPFEPKLPDGSPSGLEILPFAVPGKGAWYLESGSLSETPGDTLGLQIRAKSGGESFFFLAACARMTPSLKDRISGAPLVFFDGTLWRDDELIAQNLGKKTGQRMGHMAMSGQGGAIETLADLDIGRKIFLHINNSNPVLLPGSPERKAAEQAGWQIPNDGMEVTL